jgi:hypothetical protein
MVSTVKIFSEFLLIRLDRLSQGNTEIQYHNEFQKKKTTFHSHFSQNSRTNYSQKISKNKNLLSPKMSRYIRATVPTEKGWGTFFFTTPTKK